MENKYFTPDIEDFCIGYELEMNWNRAYEEKWVPIKISVQDEEFAYTSELSEIVDALHDGMSEARVLYLTKEQIEAEGWKHDDRYNDVKHFYINEIQLTLYIGYLKKEIIYHHISIFHGGGIMFRGKCKDINTFRKIIKLLGI